MFTPSMGGSTSSKLMASSLWSRDITSKATSLTRAAFCTAPAAALKEQQMGSSKLRILIPALFAFFALQAVAHDSPTGMHISTKSPQAHVFFEKGMAKMEMLHTADGLENFRNAVQADPQFALGDRKSTRLNSSHGYISYAVFCLKKKKTK